MKLIIATIDGWDTLKQIGVLLVLGVVLGLIHYAVGKAPFLHETFKSVLQWLIIVVGVLILINFLFMLIGYPLVKF